MLKPHVSDRTCRRTSGVSALLALLAVLSACAGQPSAGSPSEVRATPSAATRVPMTASATTPPAIVATRALEIMPQPSQEAITAAPATAFLAAALPADTAITVPPGYRAEIYAQGLAQPTALTFGPDGRLYIAQLSGDIVTVDGPGAVAQVYIRGLERPLGLVWRDADLYVLSQGTLSIFPNSGAEAGTRRDLLTGIPTAGMQNNNLVLGRDGWLYMGIGSLCDHCRPDNPISGQIRRIKPDGSSWQTYATGLRNAFGLTVAPDGTLWATDNGREDLPSDLPPEELNQIVSGGDYGWPRCYGNRVPDPQGGGTASNCAATIPPVALFPAHTSPVGLVFATGNAFAPEDQGALFVGLAGAWDRLPEHGRRIVRVRLHAQAPAETIDWSTGWGRPVGLLITPDSALLVADLDRGTLTRIVWAQ